MSPEIQPARARLRGVKDRKLRCNVLFRIRSEEQFRMGIEFAAMLEPAVEKGAVQRLKAHIVSHAPFKLNRDQGEEFGFASDDGGLEVLTVMLRPERVYVVFQAVSRSDREAFLRVVEEGLSLNGMTEAQFEEL